MKTPSFWYTPPTQTSIISTALTPLSTLYNALRRKHIEQTQTSIDLPVLSIGNITAGGSGKTPTAIALAKCLENHKLFNAITFVTRGFGGTIETPTKISKTMSPALCGDEALLLSEIATTIVSPHRRNGALYAKENGADCVILDDGLQNKTLKPSLSFCVIDGAVGLGNQKLIPSGPLREPIAEALNRIDAIILIGTDTTDCLTTFPSHIPIFKAHLRPDDMQTFPTHNYIAFSGLALPEKFKRTLNELNVNILDYKIFPDHHRYTQNDLDKLITTAQSKKARLITTAKDFVKIKHLKNADTLIDVLNVSIHFDDEQTIIQFIKEKLDRK